MIDQLRDPDRDVKFRMRIVDGPGMDCSCRDFLKLRAEDPLTLVRLRFLDCLVERPNLQRNETGLRNTTADMREQFFVKQRLGGKNSLLYAVNYFS